MPRPGPRRTLRGWLPTARAPDRWTAPPELRLALANLGTQPAARAFAAAVGDSAAEPVEVDGRAYDGGARWQVAVRTSELPLSAAFDARVDRLRSLAAEHGGAYGGCAGVVSPP